MIPMVLYIIDACRAQKTVAVPRFSALRKRWLSLGSRVDHVEDERIAGELHFGRVAADLQTRERRVAPRRARVGALELLAHVAVEVDFAGAKRAPTRREERTATTQADA